MADEMNMTMQAPEDCTHNCMTCQAGCENSEAGDNPGKIFGAIEEFSKIESDDLLKILAEVTEE